METMAQAEDSQPETDKVESTQFEDESNFYSSNQCCACIMASFNSVSPLWL